MAKKKPAAPPPETISQRFARRLLAEAERQGITQTELAARAGVHRPTIHRLAKGERTATLESAEQLAGALGKQLWELLAPEA